MLTAYVVVTLLAIAANAYAAAVDFLGSEWVVANMVKYGIPRSWLFGLGALKAAGALGLIVGIGVPLIGIAAAAGLTLYFIGAVGTVVRARCYSDIPYPVLFLLPAAGSLALRMAVPAVW